ncbi:type VII secretion-associated serine protease mycosin [Knoellia remsis]|uniref:Type VII secretion-associated serine protease mycosin n=1 Tax=Knoellia remsis TaxID=407159 RepID=A0A2T0UEG8_9MICO|nr:S8 family serine peptidase [Knoellia remsis]PRY56313.1 type VII secretion-associated serine protease mycosin [Knoellia remsis]
MTTRTGRARTRTASRRAVVAAALLTGAATCGVPAPVANAAVAPTVTTSATSLTAEARPCTEGQTRYVAEAPAALSRLGARKAWELATGKGVVVAVVDSGVAANNVHFPKGSVLPGRSFVGGPATTDESGHGTAIAGIIAARSIGDRSGVVGIARDATILPVKITGGENGGDEAAQRSANLAKGIAYAVSAGADVINLSLSTSANRPDVRAAVASATRAGVVVVASAGNRDQAAETRDGPRFPAANPGVIGVSAANSADIVTQDSIRGSHVDLAAPGDNIATTFRSWGDCVFSQQGQSTSYATAYVSGAAALLKQRFPSASPAEISYRLETTASRGSRTSRDDASGWGIVQPYEAMTAVLDDSVAGPVPPGGTPRATPPPQVSQVDLTPAPDPRAPDRNAVLWLLLGSVAAVIGLGLLRMLRATSKS